MHINDQTVNDEATIPFGGVGASGNGGRPGGPRANREAFTETQWVTVRGDLPAYSFQPPPGRRGPGGLDPPRRI